MAHYVQTKSHVNASQHTKINTAIQVLSARYIQYNINLCLGSFIFASNFNAEFDKYSGLFSFDFFLGDAEINLHGNQLRMKHKKTLFVDDKLNKDKLL